MSIVIPIIFQVKIFFSIFCYEYFIYGFIFTGEKRNITNEIIIQSKQQETLNKNNLVTPTVTNNTTNIIINNLTYLNAPAGNSIGEEINRTSINIKKNPDNNQTVVDQLKIISQNVKDVLITPRKNENNFNNILGHEGIQSQNIINNASVNNELIEKIQNEIKHLEQMAVNSNNILINNLNNPNNPTVACINSKTQTQSINTTITNTNSNTSTINSTMPNISIKNHPNEVINSNTPTSTIHKNKEEISANDSNILNSGSTKKENPNKVIERYIKKKVSPYSVNGVSIGYNTEKNNTSLSKKQESENKYIVGKLAAKKIQPKNAFFNTSMSFDQNNDTKNTTFDNDTHKKDREKSDDKKNQNGSSLNSIANSLKNNSILKNKVSNNENYLLKKSVNKKFDTIREEDEDHVRKPTSYLNYYTKFVPESRNINMNYYSDINHTNNFNRSNNANNINNSSVLKKITKIFNNEPSFLEQYITNKNNYSKGKSPHKSSVSPAFKNAANSSRISNNTSLNKSNIYTITENSHNSSVIKSKNKSINNNSKTKHIAALNQTTYSSINKSDIIEYAKAKRQKNISVPNVQKLLPTTAKYKKLNNSNINNYAKDNNNNVPDPKKGLTMKSPLKKPPMSTSLVSRKASTIKSYNPSAKVAMGNSNLMNNSLIIGSNDKNEKSNNKNINNKQNFKDSQNYSHSKALVTEENSSILLTKSSIAAKKGSVTVNSDNLINSNFMQKTNNTLNDNYSALNQNNTTLSKIKITNEEGIPIICLY